MFDLFLGLPLHILVIHAVVVIVPLAGMLAIAYVARPGWRRLLRWPTAGAALVAGVTAFIAAQSGERLEARVATTRASTTDFDLLARHTEWGDRANIVCLLFMVLTIAAVFVLPPPDRDAARPGDAPAARRRSRRLDAVAAAVVTLTSLAALVTIAIAGHAGSQVVWSSLG